MIGLARSRKRMLLPRHRTGQHCLIVHKLSQRAMSSFRGYAEEGGKVYYAIDQFSPASMVIDADPNTFLTYNWNSGIGKDKSHVYYEGTIIANADPASFGFIEDEDADYGPDAKDASHIFCYSDTSDSLCHPPRADIDTFSELLDYFDNHYAKDKNHVYVNCSIDPNIDAQDFSVLPYSGDVGDGMGPEGPLVTYFKNDEGVYFVNIDGNGNLIGSPDPALVVGADPNTFVVTNWETEEGHDKNHTYIEGKMVQ